MPVFTYKAASIRALVTFTNSSEKDLEIQVGYQRFKAQEFNSYNFPAPPSEEQSHELAISAFLYTRQNEEVSVKSLYTGGNEALFAVFAPQTAGGSKDLPDAYIVLVAYR